MNKLPKTKQIQKIVKLFNSKQFTKAKDLALKLLQSNPKDTIILNLLGAIYDAMEEISLAKKYFLQALEINSDDYSAYNNLGFIYLKEHHYKESKTMFEKAIRLKPDTSILYANLAAVYLNERDYDRAESLYQKSLSLGLNTFDLYFNLAKLYMAVNKKNDTQKMFEQALSLEPTNADALFEYSLFFLSQKRYEEGFALYHHRYDSNKKERQTHILDEKSLLKKSIDIKGKRLLLTYEQGFGDTIQFARYFPLFERTGAQVLVQTKELLFELLQKNFPTIRILHENEVESFDYHMPLLDAAYYFDTSYDTIPSQYGYLGVLAEDAIKINEKYFRQETKKRVGIVWRTNIVASESFSKQQERASRNIPLEDFIARFNFEQVQLYSLQVNVTDEERMLLEKHKIPSLGDSFISFYDNALVIDNLDMVVGIDTVSVILAGAMGKEAIILLSSYPDWRWTKEGLSTNWFKSITLLRQTKKDDWQSVLEDASKTLKSMIEKNPLEFIMQKATYAHQAGDLAGAENLYRAILEKDPNNSGAYHFLGLIAYQTGNVEPAIALITQALTLNPDDKEAYASLEAIIANSQTSEFSKKYLNLRNEKFNISKFSARSLQHDLNENEKRLVEVLDKELENIEKNPSLRCIITLYLEMLKGNFYEGLQNFLAVDFKDNASLEEHIIRLNLLCKVGLDVQGFYFKAEEYELIAKMFAAIFNNRNLEKRYQTQYIIMYYNFYMIDRSIAFQSSLQRVSKIFQEYILVKLNVEALVILYDKISFLYWGLSQGLEYLKVCDEMIMKPFSKYLLEYFKVNKFEKRECISNYKKKRVCYLGSVTSYGGAYAVGRVMYSLFKGHHDLNSADFDFYYYAYGATDETFLQEIVDFGFKIRRFDQIDHLPQKLIVMRQAFFEDEIDIAISEMPWGVPTYLFESRVAPVQIYFSLGFHYWSLQNVDKLVLNQEATIPGNRDNFVNLDISMDMKFLKPYISAEVIQNEKNKYPQDKVILGTVQRLIKISKEYLKVCEGILRNNKNTILIIAGSGNKDMIIDYFKNTDIQSRVFVPGFVDTHLYAHIIDIFLDTFPFPGGQSALDAMAYGKPVVHMSTQVRILLSKKGRDKRLVAYHSQEYTNIVKSLISDKEFYKSCSNEAHNIVREYTDVIHSAREFETLYKSLVGS